MENIETEKYTRKTKQNKKEQQDIDLSYTHTHDDVTEWKYFRVNGTLWGESTGHRWLPLTKASDAESWCFLWSAPEQMVQETIDTSLIWDAIALIMTPLLWNHDLVMKRLATLNPLTNVIMHLVGWPKLG